jgi:serine/threonine protein kinase
MPNTECYHRTLVLNEQIGQYRITSRLGQGGMGEIFAAHDEALNRTVAVKVIATSRLASDQSRRLFLREARAAAALDHPFICAIHNVLEHEGQPLIIMEMVQGETLQDRIERGPLPLKMFCSLAIEIAEALAAAHARGIVHRDIKSNNIMITPSGHIKVMDFGLALMVASMPEEETAHVSERMKVAGTLPYIAPEVLRGEEATPAADLYSFGVVLYEMATARRPFAARTDALLISDILNRQPTPPRQIIAALPRAIDSLILRLLAKEQRGRPASAEQVIDELRNLTEPQRPKSQRSLAVLPFRTLTPDTESAHLGLALADATISELALLRSLLVRPTAAILRYADADVDPIAAGRELGVDAVVAGTFQRLGSRIRVSVQLISVGVERPLWSTKVDTTLDDMFATQDEVSRKIADALQIELTPAEEQRIGRRAQAPADVLDLCTKGRLALLLESVPAVNTAIDFFEKARELDSRNPLPWIGLADAYSRLAFTWDPEGGWHEKAREMCDRALNIDPQVPEGRYLRARLAWTPQEGFDHAYAITELMGAISERPNLYEAWDWLATVLFHVGLVEEAISCYNRAEQINPDDAIARTHVATVMTLLYDYPTALRKAKDALAVSESSWAAYSMVVAQIHLGDLDGAERSLEAGARKFPAFVLFQSARAVIAALRKDEGAAMRAIERTNLNRKAYGHFHHAEFDVACALATLGRSSEAIDWLTSAARNGLPCLSAVRDEPLLASLRNESRYRDLVTEVSAQRDRYRDLYEGLRPMIWST